MWERLVRMLVKEFIQIFRDPRMKPILFGTPIIQLFVIGYAVTTDVREVALAVADFDRSQASRELVRRFEGSGYFRLAAELQDGRRLRELIDRGQVKAALQFDPGFSRDLARGETAAVQVIVDGTDSNTASVVLGYATRILTRYNQERMQQRLAAQAVATGSVHLALDRLPGLTLESRVWYNPDLRSQLYYVPGVIAILIFLTLLLLTSMAIVREREIGTMEQLMVSPIRPAELILGKTLPFALIGFFDMALITTLAAFWFEVPIRGTLALLVGATALYLMPVLGIGLFISTISHTQQQAMMSTFFFFQPAMLLSGFAFPIANMPEPIQWLTYLNPLRYYLIILRGLFLKGNGADILWPELLSLFLLGGALLAASTLRFRKRLE
jgi:ABC-2 type transport system permease protein